MNGLLHTPEGVRDIYNEECELKNRLEQRILKTMHQFGFNNIETPTFEFFDVFNKERGSVSDKEMYKFVDRYNNTLVLRPDITPSIARAATKFINKNNLPLRFCYLENTFINPETYEGRLSETTQSGAELIGDGGSYADANMIAMSVMCLKNAGLKDFKVEIGNVNFYRSLIKQSKFTDSQEEKIISLIEEKNFYGVEEFTSSIGKMENSEIFLKLPSLFGDINRIKEALKYSLNKEAADAINSLIKLHEILKIYEVDEYVSYDLGMLSKYEYYTGVIFKGFAAGMGDYVLSGGRYDSLFLQFGVDTSAIGFGITVDRLLTAIKSQKYEEKVQRKKTIILYRDQDIKEAVKMAEEIRQRGEIAILQDVKRDQEYYKEYSGINNIETIILIDENGRNTL